jgi:hypothetical protein
MTPHPGKALEGHTLAYYENLKLTVVKSFITLALVNSSVVTRNQRLTLLSKIGLLSNLVKN